MPARSKCTRVKGQMRNHKNQVTQGFGNRTQSCFALFHFIYRLVPLRLFWWPAGNELTVEKHLLKAAQSKANRRWGQEASGRRPSTCFLLPHCERPIPGAQVIAWRRDECKEAETAKHFCITAFAALFLLPSLSWRPSASDDLIHTFSS